MEIIFDHQIFSRQIYGGISRYHCELIKEFKLQNTIVKVPLWFSKNRLIDSSLSSSSFYLLGKSNFLFDKIIFKLNSINTLLTLKSSKNIIFHPTYYSNYYVNKISNPTVITVHDLIHEKFFKRDQIVEKYLKSKKIAIENADHIIAISNNTKLDLIDYYDLDPEKISVIYHGSSKINNEDRTTIIDRSEIKYRSFILYVGDRRGYKNFNFMLKAISSILLKYDIGLICCGSPFNTYEREQISNLSLNSLVKQVRASEVELKRLYNEALLFIYPSLYEGFGLPILEAFSNNCPVCVSNTSCMPEVAGDAASYFNPLDSDSIQNSVNQVIEDDILREKMIQKGTERQKVFTWEKTAIETLGIYKKLL